jgi:hypothetical protein
MTTRPLLTALASEPEKRPVRSGSILPFARPGALLPGDLQAISCFAAKQRRAQLQFAELDKGRTVALLEISTKRLRIERRGETVMARRASGGVPFASGSIDDLLAAVQAWLATSPVAYSATASEGEAGAA